MAWLYFRCLSFSTQEIQTVMTELTKGQELMKQERENFSLEAAEMENTLKEAEALLV